MARIDWSQHRSLAVLADLLPNSPPPEPAAFDPAGAWDHRYAVVLIVPDPGGVTASATKLGWLRLQRRPERDGVTFEVDQGVQHAGGVLKIKATLSCAADDLTTPRSWTIDCALWRGGPQPELVADGTVPTIRGEAKDGRLQQRVGDRGKVRSWPAPARYTAHWCLFDVVQRLGTGLLEPFDLFEDMDLHKPGQRLLPHPETTAEWDGLQLRVRTGSLDTGRAYLPPPAVFTAYAGGSEVLGTLRGAALRRTELLECLSAEAPGVWLAYNRDAAVDWRDRQIKLRGYDMLGHGFLPYTWWLDESGRVVIAAGAQRAYLWDPQAGLQEAGR